MKILQVIHGYPPRFNAGSEVYTQTLTRALVKNGNDVRVFSREENPFEKDYNLRVEYDSVFLSDNSEKKIPIYLINVPRQKDRFVSKGVDDAFKDILAEFKPAIVHFQHLNHLSITLPKIAKSMGAKLMFTLHDFWLSCPRGQFLQINYGEENPLMLCSGQSDKKCAQHCYSRYFTGATYKKNLKTDLSYWTQWVKTRRLILKDQIQSIDLFISPSKYLMSRMKQELKIPDSKIVYLDYGFDHERLKNRLRKSEEQFVFGYIGTHIVSKGIHILIRAFSKLEKSAKLRIWGRARNETTPYLKKLANEVLKDKQHLQIEWLSEYQNESIIESVFNFVDAIVVPSIWAENSPLVIHEALQARVPVITADFGGMKEYVKHEVNGLLFKHRDIDSLAEMLNFAIDNPEKMRELGLRGYLLQETGDVISDHEHVQLILSYYNSLLKEE